MALMPAGALLAAKAAPWLKGAGALGSLMSGASSLFGKSSKGPDLYEQSIAQLGHQGRSFDQLMKKADKHGIHKLAMLGVNPGGGMQFQFGGGSSDSKAQALHNMGQGISRAASAFDTNIDRQAKMLTLQSARADLENKQLHNMRLRSEMALMSQAPPPIEMLPDQQIMARHGDSGMTAGDHSGYKNWDVGEGFKVELPYSDEGIAESLEGLPWPYAYLKMAEIHLKRTLGQGKRIWKEGRTPGHYLSRKLRERR